MLFISNTCLRVWKDPGLGVAGSLLAHDQVAASLFLVSTEASRNSDQTVKLGIANQMWISISET